MKVINTKLFLKYYFLYLNLSQKCMLSLFYFMQPVLKKNIAPAETTFSNENFKQHLFDLL